MKISTKTEYALRALLELAVDDSNKAISLKEVCTRQNLPLKFIEQVFRKLKKKSLVKSVRGPKGGYFLNKSPNDISVNDIMIALEDDFTTKPCENNEIHFCSGTNCNIYSVLNKIEIDMSNYFSDISLENILTTPSIHYSQVTNKEK